MWILGLNHGEINSSAALVCDGQVVAAAPEERFNRQKKTKSFPHQAVQFCLQHAGITMKDVHAVAQGWNPGAAWEKFNPAISGNRIRREDYFYTVPDHLFRITHAKPPQWVKQEFGSETAIPPVYYIQHHSAHAANAFYLSNFEEAAFCTLDWRGEFESMSSGRGRGADLEFFNSQKLPDSLGMLYATFTELLGYRPDNDEWKVMALSAFDVDHEPLLAKIRKTVNLLPGGVFELDQSYYQGVQLDRPKLYTPKLVELVGGFEGVPGAEPSEQYQIVAKAMQMLAEEIAVHVLNHLHQVSGSNNLCLGGGFFMNSVFNGRSIEKTPFENLFVSYAPADVGNSIGAALFTAHHIQGTKRDSSLFRTSFLGPEFSDCQIAKALSRRGIAFENLEDPAATTAQLIFEGNIVAVMQGRMEFGERALGHRSILGDPRGQDVKDKINSMIKYREGYRPFAPATLQEKVSEYFEVPPDFTCPYMEKVVSIREAYRSQLPAVTHVDGSGRVQTVDQNDNPFFHAVISQFGVLSKIPIVLNTSFNISGEPVVCTPDDALSTFYNSGLRHLVLGSYLVTKSN